MLACTLTVKERDALSDLMSKLEQRTSERNEAMQVSVSAEARLQVRCIQ